jgi:hypothetical protein
MEGLEQDGRVESATRDIISRFKGPSIYYIGNKKPDQFDKTPAMRLFETSALEYKDNRGGEVVELSFTLVIYDLWPDGCESWEDLLSMANADIKRYKAVLSKMIRLYYDRRLNYGFYRIPGRGGAVEYQVMNYPIGPDRHYCVTAKVKLGDRAGIDCCDDSQFELGDIFNKSPWGNAAS